MQLIILNDLNQCSKEGRLNTLVVSKFLYIYISICIINTQGMAKHKPKSDVWSRLGQGNSRFTCIFSDTLIFSKIPSFSSNLFHFFNTLHFADDMEPKIQVTNCIHGLSPALLPTEKWHHQQHLKSTFLKKGRNARVAGSLRWNMGSSPFA